MVAACPVCGGGDASAVRRVRDAAGRAGGEFTLRRCARCTAWWVDDRLPERDVGDAYGGDYYSFEPDQFSAAGDRSAVQRARRRLLAARYGRDPSRLLRVLGRRVPTYPTAATPGLALDVGCGAGDRVERMRAAGWRAVGVDLAAPGLVAAARRGIGVARARGERLPFASGRFGAVVMSHSIEHTYDPVAALREVARVLRPGGEAVVTTPNPASVLARLFREDWVNWDVPRHTVLLTPAAMRHLARRAGLELRRVRGSSTGWSLLESVHLRRHGSRSPAGARFAMALQGVAFLAASAVNLTPWADEVEYVLVRPRRADGASA
jgi:SAM-dependent methyltransferase